MTFAKLDQATMAVGQALAEAFQSIEWMRIRHEARWTPSGDVGSDDYWVEDLSGMTRKVLPEIGPAVSVSKMSKNHWQVTQDLGQPRWYKMTVTVERSGKFSVDFEYKDDYQEGDIMKRG